MSYDYCNVITITQYWNVIQEAHVPVHYNLPHFFLFHVSQTLSTRYQYIYLVKELRTNYVMPAPHKNCLSKIEDWYDSFWKIWFVIKALCKLQWICLIRKFIKYLNKFSEFTKIFEWFNEFCKCPKNGKITF